MRKHEICRSLSGSNFYLQQVKKLGTENELKVVEDPGFYPLRYFFRTRPQSWNSWKTCTLNLGSKCGIWFTESTSVAQWPTVIPVLVNLTSEFKPVESTSVTRTRTAWGLEDYRWGYLAVWKISCTGIYFSTSSKAQFCRLLSTALLSSIPPETSEPNIQLHESGEAVTAIDTCLITTGGKKKKISDLEMAWIHRSVYFKYIALLSIVWYQEKFLIKWDFFFLASNKEKKVYSFSFEILFFIF